MSNNESNFEIVVEGMTCEHCKRAVTNAVESLPGVKSVHVDLATGKVTGTGEVASQALKEVIEEEGYSVKN